MYSVLSYPKIHWSLSLESRECGVAIVTILMSLPFCMEHSHCECKDQQQYTLQGATANVDELIKP